MVYIIPASHWHFELSVPAYWHAKISFLLKAPLSLSSTYGLVSCLTILPPFLSFSPPICRAEGDLTDGSRKFSPNSESSLEPQKTCGEQYFCLCCAKHIFIRTCTVVLQSIHSLTHWLTPNDVGDSFLSGSEDQSCWMHSPSSGNPINLQEELFHGAILSSHLNI